VNGAGHEVCLLLGSNIQADHNLPLAAAQLRQQLTILKVSSVWETPAAASAGPNFLNAALLARCALDAETLKEQVLRPLEARLGRVRSADKHAPRTIDLDIILFDGRLLDPTLWEQAHRAVPVAELLPDYRSGTGESLKQAAIRLAAATPILLRGEVSLKILDGSPHPQ
jgi:2-amino-4-hydroxy-6-hydroxymethyldihydropteridine diphosphokinase